MFPQAPNISRLILSLYAEVFALLEKELRAADFLGPLGIDAFVYRDPAGHARLKPIVEINPRYTMGRVTVELMRQVCQNSSGTFRLLNLVALRADGCEDFPSYARRLARKSPLKLEGEPVHQIRSGALCLNDPERAQVCLAVFDVRG